MAHRSDKSIVQHFLVAFLDVLGQRERLRSLPLFPKTAEEIKKTKEIFTETLGLVLRLRSLSEEFFRAYKAPSEFFLSLSKAEQKRIRELRRTKVQVHGFSDSFILAVPLRTSADHLAPVIGVHTALLSASLMPINSMGFGHALRGGIDVALGVHVGGGEVYGAALERAYSLEHDAAVYPRVAVGNQLIRYLEFVRDQEPSNNRVRCASVLAKQCLGFLSLDDDHQPILDYLGVGIRAIGQKAITPQIVNLVCEFAARELARCRAAGSKKLTERYERLNAYLSSRRPLWTS